MSRINKRPDAVGGSFLPEDYLRKKAERRSIGISIFLFSVVILGVIGAFFVTNRQWFTVKSLQEDINRQYAAETKKIEQLKVLEAQKAEMLEKAEITTALIEKVPRSILLAEMINRMPKQLTLTDLNIKSKRIVEQPKKEDKPKPRSLAAPPGVGSNKPPSEFAPTQTPGGQKTGDPGPKPVPTKFEFKIELTGLSGSDDDVADYHAALVQCPLLEKVELLVTGDVVVDDVQMRKFRIEATIRPTADARQIEPLHIPRLPMRPALAGKRAVDPMDPTVPLELPPRTDAGHSK